MNEPNLPDEQPQPTPPQEDTLALVKRRPVQAVAIGLTLTAIVGAFAYVGGFLSSDRLTPEQLIGVMDAAGGGPHAGFRRAHAKGVCIAGDFVGTPAARALSTAAVFDGRRVPVSGRFADGSGDPKVSDADAPVRSMAVMFQLPGADQWRTAMNDTPGNVASTPKAFYDNLVSQRPDPATGKPDPAKRKAFLDANPEAAAYMARSAAKPLASSFANDTYNGLNGFVFVAPDGTRRLVRWSMEAQDPFATIGKAERATKPANYLFDDLQARLRRGPIRWQLVATIARPGDPNRAAVLWPADRQRVVLGALTISSAISEAAGNCRDINFDPMILPKGIEPSDDPILYARSAAYSTSFRRRSGEHKPPSAVVVGAQTQGAPR